MEWLQSHEIIKSWLTIVGGLLALSFGLYRYHKGQLWKKSEFAASQLDLLWKDDRIRFCCLALDCSTKSVTVPAAHGPAFTHTARLMQEALRTENERVDFDWPLSYYRECFDRFFDYLSTINHYIDIGLFTAQDILPLHYWLKQIASPRFLDSKPLLVDYCRYHDFDGVEALLKKIERHLGRQ